jgi:chromosomal replication initiation ATPase DnaA
MILNRCASLPGDCRATVNPRHVVAEIAERHGLTPAQVRGEWRYPDLMAARREIALRLRAEGFSYPAIGRALSRTHATIITMLGNVGHPQSRRREWQARV